VSGIPFGGSDGLGIVFQARVSYQLSVISYQLSVIRYQLSVIRVVTLGYTIYSSLALPP